MEIFQNARTQNEKPRLIAVLVLRSKDGCYPTATSLKFNNVTSFVTLQHNTIVVAWPRRRRARELRERNRPIKQKQINSLHARPVHEVRKRTLASVSLDDFNCAVTLCKASCNWSCNVLSTKLCNMPFNGQNRCKTSCTKTRNSFCNLSGNSFGRCRVCLHCEQSLFCSRNESVRWFFTLIIAIAISFSHFEVFVSTILEQETAGSLRYVPTCLAK